MTKRKDIDPAVVDKMVQEQLKLFAEHRKIFVECAEGGRVYITCHVRDATNDNMWKRVLTLLHLMDVELTVSYTHSPEGVGVEGVVENLSQYQIAILQKFVDCNGIIC